jgi:hypothetical protein
MKRLLLILLLSIVSSQFAILNSQIIYDLDRMNSLRDESVAADAIAGIVRDADKQLMAPCPSVTDKQRLAPSGDRHDYFSMARYWWPDPSKPDGLPYVRKDGQVNPETQDLDRQVLGQFEKMLRVYALAYFYTGKEEYAAKGWDLIRTWFINKKTRMNPTMAYSQVRMGHNNNHGSNSGLLDGYSFLIVPDALQILSASKGAKQKDIDAVRAWFTEYLQWMLSSPQGIKENAAKNNHGTAYHIQVAVYAAFTGNDSIAQTYLSSFPELRILPQVEEDGRQPQELARTRAFGYSCYNLKHYLDMMDICRLRGADMMADTLTAQRIEAAIDFLVPYLGKPVSAWPFRQIADWEKEQQTLCWILYRADRYFPQKGYKELFRQYSTAKSKDRNFLLY